MKLFLFLSRDLKDPLEDLVLTDHQETQEQLEASEWKVRLVQEEEPVRTASLDPQDRLDEKILLFAEIYIWK